MESLLTPDFHFDPTDEDIMDYLYFPADCLPSPREFIKEENLKHFLIDQPPDIRRDGCLGKIYWYTKCDYKQTSGRLTRDRHTVDGKGYWKSIDGQKEVYGKSTDEQMHIGYKQNFQFHLREHGREVRTTWAMREYTMYSNETNKNTIAICVLRNTRED